MRNNKLLFFILGIIFIGVLSFLLNIGIFKRSQTSQVDTDKPQVSTSFYPLYYFASEIAKDRANITNIIPAGSEPHNYEPTARQIAQVEESDLFIYNGASFDPWGDKQKDNLKNKQTLILEMTKDLATLDYQDDEGEKVRDPHIWLSPILARKEAEIIKDALIAIDPQNSTIYEANMSILGKRFEELDQKFRDGLTNCSSKTFITSHAAFGYLAQEYGLTQVAISGLSPDQEPSSQQLAQVSQFAKENNVKYIFFETLVSPKLSETIAQEIGAQTLVLDPIEGISDEESKQGKNYFTVMEGNLKNLQTALQCKN